MMNINEVQKRIKQRPPFQMIEKIVEIRDGEYAKGIKNVSINEPYFMGHFGKEFRFGFTGGDRLRRHVKISVGTCHQNAYYKHYGYDYGYGIEHYQLERTEYLGSIINGYA